MVGTSNLGSWNGHWHVLVLFRTGRIILLCMKKASWCSFVVCRYMMTDALHYHTSHGCVVWKVCHQCNIFSDIRLIIEIWWCPDENLVSAYRFLTIVGRFHGSCGLKNCNTRTSPYMVWENSSKRKKPCFDSGWHFPFLMVKASSRVLLDTSQVYLNAKKKRINFKIR